MTHEHSDDYSFVDHIPPATEHPVADPAESTHTTQINIPPPAPDPVAPSSPSDSESAVTHDENLAGASSEAPDDAFPGPDSSLSPDGSQLDGTPAQDTQYWFEQCASGWCGPASIAMVFDQMTGAHFDDQNISAVADSMGYVDHNADGSQSMGVPGISGTLTQLGIPNHIATGSIASLTHALSNGDRVIAAVDGEKIWSEQDPGKADHAVEITGIDVQDNMVYLNDPGTPNGAEEHVPLDVFEQAWSTGSNQMVVTDNPVPTMFDHSSPSDSAPSDTATPVAAPSDQGGDPTQVPSSAVPSSTTGTPGGGEDPTQSPASDSPADPTAATPTQSGTPSASGAAAGAQEPALTLPHLPTEHHQDPSGLAVFLPIRLIAELVHDIIR